MRAFLAPAGGVIGAALVALVEAREVVLAATGEHRPEMIDVFVVDFSLLAPLAVIVGVAVAALDVFLSPAVMRGPIARWKEANARPARDRARAAAIAPLATFALTAWCVGTARIAEKLLASGAPQAVGVELSLCSIALLAAAGSAALAVVAPLQRALYTRAATGASYVHPGVTGGFASLVALLVFAIGVRVGDSGGEGPTALAIFGVLKRQELDLRPVLHLVAIALFAYAAPLAVARAPGRGLLRAAWAIAVVLAALFTTWHASKSLDESLDVAQSVDRSSPLGKIALASLRKATDKDHDGYSALFAGGDCNDRDKRIHPGAIDTADNDVDEDCDGEDTKTPPPPPPPKPVVADPSPVKKPKIAKDYNLVFITVDTLRTDVGFMGYPKPTTPNLDKLAQKSVVWDRMYSLASYTGKSLGPMMIGRFPSECPRDGAHFTQYEPENVFLAERLKSAGFATSGCASFWYFQAKYSLTQGIDDWDVSAIPYSYRADTDTSVTSDKLTDVAMDVLSRKENTGKRFFFWVHYFDPHAQYMPHAGAPNFWMQRSPEINASAQASYDGEVWFTDKHIGRLLDFVDRQPWGKDTIIVVTADHGEAFGEHGVNWHGTDLWEVLVRVPFLIYVPGIEPHHVPVKRSHIDLVPTLLDLLRLPQPPAGELSGESMLPDVFAGIADDYEERDVLMDMPPGPIVLQRRAFIHGPTPGQKLFHLGGTMYQAYDLAKDPQEGNDLTYDRARVRPLIQAYQQKKAMLREIWVPPDSQEVRN